MVSFSLDGRHAHTRPNPLLFSILSSANTYLVNTTTGAPLHYAAASPVVKTPPSLTRAQRLEALRTNGGTVPFPQTPQRRPRVLEPTNYMAPVDNDDDVFVSPKSIKERRSEQASSASGAIARLDVPLANTQADHALRPSDSNLSARHQINGVDAQNLYPPTACVFVAK